MSILRMGAAEARFADVIWENEPISSGQLARSEQRILIGKNHFAYSFETTV